MASKRVKVKRVAPIVSREEFTAVIDQIARLDIKIKKDEADLKKRIQDLQDEADPGITADKAKLADLVERAEPYFQEHAGELCKPGRKEGETKLARFGARVGLPTVAKTVRTAWKALAAKFFGDDKLKRFTRATPELDKDAIQAVFRDAERLADQQLLTKHGITVEQAESEFWVEAKAEAMV